MARLKFRLEVDKAGGIISIFTDGKGQRSSSWWSSPPDNIDHVGMDYLENRHRNMKTKRHAEFIKEQFKLEMAKLEEYEPSHYRKKAAG